MKMENENKNEEMIKEPVNNKKKGIIAAVAVVVVAVLVLAVALKSCGSDNKATDNAGGSASTQTDVSKDTSAGGSSDSESSTADDGKVYTPTFMYFVTKSDDGYDAYMKTIDELKKEYEDKVIFDIRDIDENPEDKENFEMVVGNTPFLIMLNTKNDPIAFEFKCSDKDKLKTDIENAF